MKRYFFIFQLIIISSHLIYSQQLTEETFKKKLESSFNHVYEQTMQSKGDVRIDSTAINRKKRVAEFYTNTYLSYLPMRENIVNQLYDSVHFLLSSKSKYQIKIYTDGQEISNLIPNFYRTKCKDKKRLIRNQVKHPLVKNISLPIIDFKKGLTNNHIALWQSHGWYYEQKLARWEWQRARIFQTVEDLYTQSYVLPFLVPMLENAGANVLLPRERDYNKTELIIDNDRSTDNSIYAEKDGKEKWKESQLPGFANLKQIYVDGENPFRMGTARQVKTISRGIESIAEWQPNISEKGYYGVYISYQTFRNSAEDALYTVYHAGGKTNFEINQKMGGGTWIFLGNFLFEKGKDHKITLSNKSKRANRIITADAVKIGGGMGNIARMPHSEGYDKENTKSSEQENIKKSIIPKINYKPETSGYPRYTEGARYWLQWAGVPDSIYNRNESKNDYIDDYGCRGYWVNWLNGSSSVFPKGKGLGIPIDLSLAFHSDAGTYWGDSIVGTLGIYMTKYKDGKFENNQSRWASRDLTDLIMSEIVKDIRQNFEPNWTRRHMWNKSYAEARIPNVPSMLLELLSHQNFADMRYGLDPTFQFTVSRSIYKGILKFIATQYNRPYIVQPLPIKDFAIKFSNDTEVELTWNDTFDEAEPSAKPTQYIVYTRINDSGFDNGFITQKNKCNIKIEKDKIYSFKVEAVNEGGKSFPSEILSVSRKSNQKGEVLIVNGFTRISAPFSFTSSDDSIAGFLGSIDNGIPYISSHHFTGHQHEFRRIIPWMDDDASGFGDSNANYETIAIAGNTFDYPYLHGKAFLENGYSFVSASSSSINNGYINLSEYFIVDWILGKQREWTIARGAKPPKYKTFSKSQQQQISNYCIKGGKILISGAFVGTDLWDNPYSIEEDRQWAKNILKYKWRNNNGAVMGKIKVVTSPFQFEQTNYEYYNELNSKSYVVENPDAIEPIGENTYTFLRYSENNLSAGVIHKGEEYCTCILGFPIESIKEQVNRNKLIKGILNAFTN